MKVICITGTPGTGKTTISKGLAKKLDFVYIDVNRIISKHKLSEGYDKKRKTKIIDISKLNSTLINEINHYKEIKSMGLVIDSHLSHFLPKKYVNFCIVTRCGIKTLNKRLIKRKYLKNKIQENLQAEIFDVCLNEARELKHKIIPIDTSKGFNIDRLAKKIGG